MNNEENYIENEITRQLDERLLEAKSEKSDLPPVAIISGLTGLGKTPIIKSWLKHNNLQYVYVKATNLSLTAQEGDTIDWTKTFDRAKVVGQLPKSEHIKFTTVFPPEFVDKMSIPNTVIFIDDYDWGQYAIRKHLMRLIMRSEVHDTRYDGNNFIKKLDNLLMLVVVVHPAHSLLSEPYDEIEEKIFGKQS